MTAAAVTHNNHNNASTEKPVAFEEAVSLTGQGRFHWVLQLVCGVCLATTLVTMLSTGYALPYAQCDLRLATQDKGILNAICYIGMLCSSHLWGYLADTRGRRTVLLLTLVADSACTVLSSFSHSFWLLLIFRFWNGFFICGAAAVVFAYLGEFHGLATRARAVVWLGVSVAVGTICLPGLAWLVIPNSHWTLALGPLEYGPWRILLLLCALPGLLAALLIWALLPESPKFLLATGRNHQALDVLRLIFATNTGKDPLDFPVRSLQLDSPPRPSVASLEAGGLSTSAKSTGRMALEVAKSMWRQTAPLFSRQHACNLAAVCVIDFAIFACSNGFLLWLPELFSRLSSYAASHPSLNETLTVCQVVAAAAAEAHAARYFEPWLLADGNPDVDVDVDAAPAALATLAPGSDGCTADVDVSVFSNTLIIGATTAAAYILAGYAVPFVGKKRLLVLSTLLSGCCGIALHWVGSQDTVLALACLFMAPATMCISVVNSIVVDLFPTQIRAMAVCLSLMMGRLGTALGSVFIGSILEISCSSVFFILSGIVIGCGLLALTLPNHPKDMSAPVLQ
ncbi:synaptic vesicle glycoprotein 2A-like [Schistocerca piceifrons]|uniref:synaptic vesicle glycoprotein 2A-like n=1 Tax=Schistocerca piceifrons TaxID=274613 RepID=UPI001F5E72AC|nr:synaptic vesicle glycoprotein 2A-like [Schistocerca piceifrons]